MSWFLAPLRLFKLNTLRNICDKSFNLLVEIVNLTLLYFPNHIFASAHFRRIPFRALQQMANSK